VYPTVPEAPGNGLTERSWLAKAESPTNVRPVGFATTLAPTSGPTVKSTLLNTPTREGPTLTVTCATYVPAVRLVASALMVRVAGAVPVMGLTESQPAVAERYRTEASYCKP
jgi:hypothetical protein